MILKHIPFFGVVLSMQLSLQDIDRIIEMAWEDRTPFEAIKFQFLLSESQVIALMRKEMHPNNFKK